MLSYVAFAVKLQLNVHDLNNETGAGNVTDIRIMEFLDENGEKVEAPAVSGRMLKHWHYEAMRQLINYKKDNQKLPLCDGCKMGEPIRPGKAENGKLIQVAKSEKNAINECVICDIHGYLIAQGAKTEGETGVSSRRTSRTMFSWLMPVLNSQNAQKQVIHTRVSKQEEMAAGEGAAQMIFNKSYASGIYAFVTALDINRISVVDSNLINKNEDGKINKKDRVYVAIKAYQYLISGQMGASLSHAIPHLNPIEILVAYSENDPLPFPVSPMYSGFVEKTKSLMPEGSKFLYYGPEQYDGIEKFESINDIFKKLLNEKY